MELTNQKPTFSIIESKVLRLFGRTKLNKTGLNKIELKTKTLVSVKVSHAAAHCVVYKWRVWLRMNNKVTTDLIIICRDFTFNQALIRRDIEDEKLWIDEKMPRASSAEYGDSLQEVQGLQKKSQV